MSIDSVHRSLREKQRQERLELLLQAAEQVFVEKGYRDTSMDEIAARVGIGTATIYSHFASKEDLMVAAILERDYQRIVQRVEELCVVEEQATDKLTHIFQFLVSSEFFRRRATILYSMGSSPEAQKALLARQGVIAASSTAFANALISVIEQGKAEGVFQQGIATSTMLKAFIGLVRIQNVEDPLQIQRRPSVATDELLQVYLQGIIKRTE